jgi:hypothetical protein
MVTLRLALAIAVLMPSAANASAITANSITFEGVVKAAGIAANLYQLFNNTGEPTSTLSFTATGTERAFDLTILGGTISKDKELHFSGKASGLHPSGQGTTDFWSWDLVLTFTQAVGVIIVDNADKIEISGFIQHVFPPDPGDALFGPQLPFHVTIDAANQVGGNVSAKEPGLPKVEEHPGIPHFDALIKADLGAGTRPLGLGNRIVTQFTFQASARHCAQAPAKAGAGVGAVDAEEECCACLAEAVPHGPSLLLLVAGASVMFARFHVRRRWFRLWSAHGLFVDRILRGAKPGDLPI